MPKLYRHAVVQSIEWGASQPKTRALPATVYAELLLKMSLTVTNGVAPDLSAEQLAAVLSTVDLVLNGNDTLIHVPGFHLYYQHYYDRAIEPPNSIDFSAGASVTDKMMLRLPFALTRAVVPEDSVLDGRSQSSRVLQITFAAAAIGTDKTITVGTVEIITSEYAVPKDWTPPIARLELSYLQKSLDKTGEVSIDLDYGGVNQYKRIWIYTEDNTGAMSDVQIDNIKLRSRSFVYHDFPADEVQDQNSGDYAVAPKTGVYVLDLTTHGKMSQRLDARELDELVLILNSLVSNGTVKIVLEKAIYV